MGTDTLNNAFEHVINNIESKEDFIDYLKEISVESEGNKTILYSGYSSRNDVDKTFMNSLRSDPNNRMIDKTDLGKFLSSITANEGDDYFTEGQKLQRKLIDLFGSKDELTNYLFSVPNGAWDSSSKRFIEEGSGKIDIFVKTTGNPERTFFQTEWEAIKSSGKYTEINGLDILAYDKGLTINQTFVQFQTLTSQRQKVLEALNIVDGKNLNISDITISQIEDVLKNENGKYSSYISDMKKDFSVIKDNIIKYDDSINFKGIFKGLGVLGGAIGFSFVINDVVEAYNNGDINRAKEIMYEWAIEAVGGTAGGYLGSVMSGIAIASLSVAGVSIGAIPAAIIIAGASLVGGIFGADFSTDFYQNNLKDKDSNGRLDMFDKLTNFFVGVGDLKEKLPQLIQTQNGTNKVELNLANLSKEVLITNAEISPAWMYALKYLNSFVIESKDAQMEDLLYSNENKDGSLEFENYSAEYLDKRAEMLLWRLKFTEENKNFTSEYNTDAIEGNWDFIDLSEHNKLPGGENLEFKIDGKGVSLYDHQVVFGSNKDDAIEGSQDSDFLFADAGNDTIEAGKGTNYIDGGTGSDTISYKNITNSNKEGITLNLSLATAQAINSTITDTIINVENVIGSKYDDFINFDNTVILKDKKTHILEGYEGSDKIYGAYNSVNVIYGNTKEEPFGSKGIFNFGSNRDEYGNIIKYDDWLYGGKTTNEEFLASGNLTENHLYGGSGDDFLLVGRNANNYLFGGAGEDTLVSSLIGFKNEKAGIDFSYGSSYLNGGEGFDTYSVKDYVTIEDDDGSEEIQTTYGKLQDLTMRTYSDGRVLLLKNYPIYIDGEFATVGNFGRITTTQGMILDNYVLVFKLQKDGNDLILNDLTSNPTVIRIKNYIANSLNLNITQDMFNNLPSLDGNTNPTPANPILVGTNEVDTLIGSEVNNTFISNAGNDTLKDISGGNDIYKFKKGDGVDTIYDIKGNDTIIFDESVLKEDITFSQSEDLKSLIINYSPTDSITITNYFDEVIKIA